VPRANCIGSSIVQALGYAYASDILLLAAAGNDAGDSDDIVSLSATTSLL
jgi:hypothetical protein